MNWKSIIKTIHVWIGLICGAFLCITCLSGSIAVFRPQLQAAFSPKIAVSNSQLAQADPDDAASRVLAASPEAKITRVGLPTADWNAFLFTVDSPDKKSRRIVVDAATGAIAGEQNTPWLDWIIDLHHNLLFGKTGRLCVGAVGIILFLTSATGLTMSLLRRVSWKSFVTVTTSGPRHRFYFDLHRATGLWAYAFLTILSFTGIALAYPDAFRLVFGQREAIAKTKPAKKESFKSLKEYIEISRATLPHDAQVIELRLPKSAKDSISVRFHMPGDLGDAGRNEMSLAASGQVIGIRKTADEPFGVRIQSAFTPIHYGEVGGIAIRILWCLAGIGPLILYVTGLLFFFRKKPQRRVVVQQPIADEFLVTQRSF